MDSLRRTIIATMEETAEVRGTVLVSDLTDETVLLQSGLDSLGFAILVARLEEELGYDPFEMMDEPTYPRTLADFLSIYKRFNPGVK